MDHGERSSAQEAALRAVHKPAAKPWRGSAATGGAAPPPPKVYRVELRDFREQVQSLTGAGTEALGPALAAQQRATPAVVAQIWRVEAAAAAEQFDYASWFSAPLLSPAYGTAGFDGHQGNGALL